MKNMCALIAVTSVALSVGQAQETMKGQTYRLHEGITAYVNNPDGKDFSVGLDVRDLNLYANGPREILFKVYDPDGKPVVREIIPDDGCATANLPDRIGGGTTSCSPSSITMPRHDAVFPLECVVGADPAPDASCPDV